MVVGVMSGGRVLEDMALGFANKQILGRKPAVEDVRETEARKTERAGARSAAETTALPAEPQSSAQFDLSRNVIAGRGGTSSAANIKDEGIIGQPAAVNTNKNRELLY